ncbi:MAG: retropepsin-like aspartic protease [Pseudomonadota bacterium]
MYRHFLSTPCLIAVFLLSFTSNGFSEFYKYVDKDGNTHFVDDLSKIPAQYMGNQNAYKDKYDGLSETERTKLQEKEAKDRQAINERHNQWLEDTQKKQEELEKQQIIENTETKVTIQGNQVFVPTTLCYKGKALNTTLLLDTGADTTTIHRSLADRLGIDSSRGVKVEVAGGNSFRGGLIQIDYIAVGPHQKKEINVLSIPYTGRPVQFEGLLGMNFLRELKYEIDFENQVLRWGATPANPQ